MLSDKQVKKKFKVESSKNPEKFYPVNYLKSEGFIRKQCKCKTCGTFFWTVNKDQDHCGDPACIGGVKVMSNNPAKVKLSYIEVWKKIVEMLQPRGYKPINRYPVVARWNPTADFVMASIAAFQPYVITGEVQPPAKKLVIPQFSLRFGDIDNVGITGSHLTGFVMIGQHAFVSKDEWNQEEFFKDIYEFLTIGIGLPKEEITIHEDAWAGGGSFGPCLEFFSRGIELFNQVYTMYEQTPKGDRELKLKVLDMGLGMERIAWFSQGTPNIYEATFPRVLKKLREKTNIEMDHDLYKKFSQYSALLNVDEVEDMDKAWQDVAIKLEISVEELRKKILPMGALYSVAEHARTLLVAFNDGAIPSNVGGGYNLRVIFRRAQSYIDQFKWNIDMADVAKLHADELKELFPELSENLNDVSNILNVEKKKYLANKEKAKSTIEKIIQKDITTDVLVELYDSKGINPEIIREEAAKHNKKVAIPDNFYSLVEALHEKKEQVHATHKELELDIPDDEETEVLYLDDHSLLEFNAKVKYVAKNTAEDASKDTSKDVPKDKNGRPDATKSYIVLDKTAFYPTSGGQMHDIGQLNGEDVIDVIKHGNAVVHVLSETSLKSGDEVKGIIDKNQRMQLTKHHTATHIINAAAKKILGNHINQIGAKKTIDKASLDVTHYESLTDQQLKEIENEANKIVRNKIKIRKFFLKRDEAEKKYGLNIYQGGAIPGNKLRMVIIGSEVGEEDSESVDVECCAGTHLDNTSEVGKIRLLKSSKISDGVVRLSYVAGPRAEEVTKNSSAMLGMIAKELSCDQEQYSLIPARAEELFTKWKKAKKASKKGKELASDLFELTSKQVSDADPIQETAIILRTQPEHILDTIKRFKRDLDKFKS